MGLLPGRYNLDNLKLLASNPQMLLGELNQYANRVNRRFYRFRHDGRGIAVMEEDWDNLLILDGCRYDLYEDRTWLGGTLQRRISSGSDSWEFLQANFGDGTYHDTVYVTSNPHAYKLPDDVFHRVVNLLDDRWDPELQTVLPEDVAAAAVTAHEEYPNKRLLVHFMQPHFPFIGETGRRLDQGGIVMHVDDHDGEQMIWSKMRYGLVDEDLTLEAYRENLDIVLAVVEDLLEDLDGKTVVSSDHGNMVGDRLWPIPVRGYGHPRGFHAPQLLEIPWEVLEADDRRSVRADPPKSVRGPDDDVVKRRLQDLGYRA